MTGLGRAAGSDDGRTGLGACVSGAAETGGKATLCAGGGKGGAIAVIAGDAAFFLARALGRAGIAEGEAGVSAGVKGAPEGGAAFLGRGMG